jgi:hypothetical protein
MATEPSHTEYDESPVDVAQSHGPTRTIESFLAELADAGRAHDRVRFDRVFGIVCEAIYDAAWRVTRNARIAERRTADVLLSGLRAELEREERQERGVGRAAAPSPDPTPDPPPNPHKEPIPNPPKPMPDPYPAPRPNRPRAHPTG